MNIQTQFRPVDEAICLWYERGTYSYDEIFRPPFKNVTISSLV